MIRSFSKWVAVGERSAPPAEPLFKICGFVLLIWLLLGIGACQILDSPREVFSNYQNHLIGKRFYQYERAGMREVKISDVESEFIPELMPANGCEVVWMVDTRSRGEYKHANGETFQIEGTRKSWRYVGDPNKCVLEVNWKGPW